MAFDLTNTNISDTFKHLLQVRADDKTLYDAVGNVLDDFRLSGSFTTSEFLEIEMAIIEEEFVEKDGRLGRKTRGQINRVLKELDTKATSQTLICSDRQTTLCFVSDISLIHRHVVVRSEVV